MQYLYLLVISIFTLSAAQASSKWDSTDIVAHINVLATTVVSSCDSHNKSPCVYHSWLSPTEVQKGEVTKTIIVEWNTNKNSVPFLPGDTFQAFLKWDSANKVYRAAWVASKNESEKLTNAVLPVKAGVVITNANTH
ncbi:MAG: hypothetical protein CSA50_06540 [Gammaproteobacteria bacterium]|nr:MAG: hypothetical protein CSA50_06540 [Gammaproteobacteria bacterium]